MMEAGKVYNSLVGTFIYSSLDDARDGEDMLEMGTIGAGIPILILSEPIMEEYSLDLADGKCKSVDFHYYEVLADNKRGWIWDIPSQYRFKQIP